MIVDELAVMDLNDSGVKEEARPVDAGILHEIATANGGSRVRDDYRAPKGLDWICMSPKANTEILLTAGNELKLIYPQKGAEPNKYEDFDFEHFFLQPMDSPEAIENTKLTLAYCLEHPRWRLSLQTHKWLEIK